MSGRFRPHLRAAAAALRHGWDPIEFLSLTDIDAMVGYEVIRIAEEDDHERRKEMVKAFQVAVQNGVAKAFGG